MRRWVVFLAALAVLVTGCSAARRVPGHGSGSPGHLSAWEQVNAAIGPDGQVSTKTALQAFALAFGPLPGVSVPPGPTGEITSGTGALRWLVSHWGDISPAQQAAAIVLEPGLRSLAPSVPTHEPSGGHSLVEAKPLASKPKHPPAYYTALAYSLAEEIEGHIGVKLRSTIDVAERPTAKSSSDADTISYNAAGRLHGTPARCVVSVNPKHSLSGDTLEMVVAHEVWHCFEAQIVGLDQFFSKIYPRSWIREGEAEWVGYALRPQAQPDDFWEDYIDSPRQPLFARSYDAIGFYSHLADTGTDPWQALVPILQAGSDPDAFAAAGATSDRFLDTWASARFQNPSLGRNWLLAGPGLQTATGSEPQRLQVANAQSASFSAPAYANGVFQLVSSADITIVAVRGGGHVRLGDTANRRDYLVDANADTRFCTKPDGCACPPNSSYVGPPLTNIGSVILVALTAVPDDAYGAVTGQSLDRFCNPSKTPRSTPPTSPARAAGHVPDHCPSDAMVGMGYSHAETSHLTTATQCGYLGSGTSLEIDLVPGIVVPGGAVIRGQGFQPVTVAGADAAAMRTEQRGSGLYNHLYVNVGRDQLGLAGTVAPTALIALAERILRAG
jgi:hypothetical protein